MKIGDTVWVPHLKVYGTVHELSWDKKRISTIRTIDPITKLPQIINVIHEIVEAVGLIEKIVIDILSIFRKRKPKAQ
jgi:hypothetical protein